MIPIINIISADLHEYLEHEWKWNNHVKYLKYFNEWERNLTQEQLRWYQAYMEGKKTLW